MLNRVSLQGRLVRDPSKKVTNSGITLCDFCIAVQRNVKGADGTYPSDFFDCTAWRGSADFVANYFHKGDMIVLDGRMQCEKYTNKDGQNRERWTVQVDNVNLCDRAASRDTTTHEDAEPAPENIQVQQDPVQGDQELPFEV